MKKEDWEQISACISERNRLGKDSEVYWYGKRLLRETVHKEIARYSVPSSQAQCSSKVFSPFIKLAIIE